MTQFQGDSIYWVEVDRIVPNPYQPRKDFDQEQLTALADSIRQYGVLQPLTVTRKEHFDEHGGMRVEYELIAGERRHRASRLAGLAQVPVIIRSGEENALLKLELAIIENVQREDLNPIDRAKAFKQLADEFGFKHAEIAKKVGKSREYVSNSIRLVALPDYIQQALTDRQIGEGVARPLLMLNDKPEEQKTLFKEVIYKKLTVREAESIARKVAKDKVRNKSHLNTPVLSDYETRLSETLGTRVQIEKKEKGGRIHIHFFSDDDIQHIISLFESANEHSDIDAPNLLDRFLESTGNSIAIPGNVPTPLTQGQKEDEDREVKSENGISVSESNPTVTTTPEIHQSSSATDLVRGVLGRNDSQSSNDDQSKDTHVDEFLHNVVSEKVENNLSTDEGLVGLPSYADESKDTSNIVFPETSGSRSQSESNPHSLAETQSHPVFQEQVTLINNQEARLQAKEVSSHSQTEASTPAVSPATLTALVENVDETSQQNTTEYEVSSASETTPKNTPSPQMNQAPVQPQDLAKQSQEELPEDDLYSMSNFSV